MLKEFEYRQPHKAHAKGNDERVRRPHHDKRCEFGQAEILQLVVRVSPVRLKGGLFVDHPARHRYERVHDWYASKKEQYKA